MKLKLILAGSIFIIGIMLLIMNFIKSTVDYGTFAEAQRTGKKIQVKGEWVKNRETKFDANKEQFTFYLKDDEGHVEQVVLNGAEPNNFELASNIVVKGRYNSNCFYATEVLTKCPSKYESNQKNR